MRNNVWIFAILGLALLISGCSGQAPEATAVPPTKTPKPTFTPTPDWSPTPIPFPTATPEAAVPTAPEVPTAAPTEVEPSPTLDVTARFRVSQTVNVRSGPGTNYPRIGQVGAGDVYEITGTNPGRSWYEFSFEGRRGWITAGLVDPLGDTDAVAVAENIPAAPRPPTPRPQPTAVPQPQPQPQPPAQPPAPAYKYNRVSLVACRPQAGGTWFDGTVYYGGQPVDGERAVFSYAAGGPYATEPMVVGPHPGYPGWNHGYFSHIISVPHPVAGDWFVWIIDGSGNRISEIGRFHSDGAVPEGTGCNDATFKFEG